MNRGLQICFWGVITGLIGCARGPGEIPLNEAKYALRLISETTTLGIANDVYVVGDSAFIADNEQGVTIWDVSQPGSPRIIDTVPTIGGALMVKYSPLTDLVFVVENTPSGGITAYQCSTKMRLMTLYDRGVADFTFQELSHSDSLVVAEVDGGIGANRGEGYRFHKLYRDLSLGWLDDLRGSYMPPVGNYKGLCLYEDTTFIAYGEFGVDILRVNYSTLGNFPVERLGATDTPGNALSIALNRSREYALIADSHKGLAIVDVKDRRAPRFVGSVKPEGFNRSFKVWAVGDTAYVLEQFWGVYAVDVSEPHSPRIIALYQTGRPTSIFVTSDHTLFISDEWRGLMILRWR
ncbi:MAG: LVIVD repeat-containing protein, partial [bacterium]